MTINNLRSEALAVLCKPGMWRICRSDDSPGRYILWHANEKSVCRHTDTRPDCLWVEVCWFLGIRWLNVSPRIICGISKSELDYLKTFIWDEYNRLSSEGIIHRARESDDRRPSADCAAATTKTSSGKQYKIGDTIIMPSTWVTLVPRGRPRDSACVDHGMILTVFAVTDTDTEQWVLGRFKDATSCGNGTGVGRGDMVVISSTSLDRLSNQYDIDEREIKKFSDICSKLMRQIP